MKRSTTTSITLVVALTALAACATPVTGKVVPVKKYMETHSREEFRAMMEAKTGKHRSKRPSRDENPTDANASANSERGRSLSAFAYCEKWEHCDNDAGPYGEWCEQDWTPRRTSSGDEYYAGRCIRECWSDNDCGAGTFCGWGSSGWQECLPCSQHYSWNGYSQNCQRTCTADSDCTEDGTYCAYDYYTYAGGKCSTCHDCYTYNAYSGSCSACTTFLNNYANSASFLSADMRGDAESFSKAELPSDCWQQAAEASYDEMYVGDCGAFGEETELWCDGFCLADSWLDCCDPKAGAIAALTMGCFFSFVGALFSVAWIFKCWCFKKPNALMLQAMANQQQQRVMAAGQMQSPVVVQMQAPVTK